MSVTRPRSYSRLVAAIIVASLVVTAGIFASAYIGTVRTRTVTVKSTTTQIETVTAQTSTTQSATSTQSLSSMSTQYSTSSTNSTDGLQLELILNSTSIQLNGTIAVQIELMNVRDQNVSFGSGPVWNQTIPILNGTLSQLNAFDYVCSDSPSAYLVNFLLFRGHITAGNISAAGTPLQEGPPVYPPCAGLPDLAAPITFLPHSDQVLVGSQETSPVTAELNASTLYCASDLKSGGFSCGYGQGLVGYWISSAGAVDGNLGFMDPGFKYFPPGEYTIVAFDAWNQYSYATFIVE